MSRAFPVIFEDSRDLIERLEREGERVAERMETCRKAMLIARAMILVGAALFLVDLLGFVRLAPTLALLGLGGAIAGIVIYGAHHSTRVEADEQLRKIETERARLIDGLEFRGASLH